MDLIYIEIFFSVEVYNVLNVLFRVVVGKNKADCRGDSNTITVRIVEMVLLNLEECKNEWPQVVQVIDFNEGTCMIHWYRGSKTKFWKRFSRIIQ